MTWRRTAFACAVGVAIVAAVGVALRAPRDARPAVAQPGATTSVAAPAAAARPPRNREPLPEGDAGATHATLVRLAEAGNGAAALRLAQLIGLCEGYVPRTRESVEQQVVDGMAVLDAPRNAGEARQQEALVTLFLDAHERQEAACPGYDALGITDPVAQQRRWIETAARLGEARALVDLADRLIRKYPHAGDIVEHAEEMRGLRPQAIALLQQAVAAGEPAALLRMSAAHRTGDLARADPVEAYAWMLAYDAGPPLAEIPRSLVDTTRARMADALDDAQRADAQRRAEAIRARCCGG